MNTYELPPIKLSQDEVDDIVVWALKRDIKHYIDWLDEKSIHKICNCLSVLETYLSKYEYNLYVKEIREYYEEKVYIRRSQTKGNGSGKVTESNLQEVGNLFQSVQND